MREYLLVFFTAVTVTYVLAVVARELAMWTGAYARVRDRDVHEIPIPSTSTRFVDSRRRSTARHG